MNPLFAFFLGFDAGMGVVTCIVLWHDWRDDQRDKRRDDAAGAVGDV